MSGRERLALTALLTLRVALGAARFAATPARLYNTEEAYNATVAWLLSRAPLWDQLPTLQYRSFCGGCSAVSALGAPLLWAGDRLWAWKILALLWTAAIGLAGFLALRGWLGRAPAFAFLALYALPGPGPLDLSLMLWGNHQESGLFLVLGLLALTRGAPLALGLSLGLGLWFARTSAYLWPVLLPLGWMRNRDGRMRLVAGLALGLSPMLVPAASGEHGWYDLRDPLGGSLSEALERAATLLAPAEWAARWAYPARDLGWVGAGVLAIAGLGAVALARARRGWPLLALGAAFALAYSAVDFPIYLVKTQQSVNNIRYHAPWFLLLTLITGAGLGLMWAEGRRRLAGGLLTASMGLCALALARLPWAPDPRALEQPATNLPLFVQTVTLRLPVEVLARGSDDPRAGAMLDHMRGLKLGRAVAQGELPLSEALAALPSPAGLGGLGGALLPPCAPADRAEPWLDAVGSEVGPELRLAVGRGIAATLSLCPQAPRELSARLEPLRITAACELCSAAGGMALRACGADAPTDRLAACLARYAGDAEGTEILYGAGRAWADPQRAAAQLDALAEALGAASEPFLAGAADPAAGGTVPPFPRSLGAPEGRPGPPSP